MLWTVRTATRLQGDAEITNWTRNEVRVNGIQVRQRHPSGQ
jgi:hypothetical protein